MASNQQQLGPHGPNCNNNNNNTGNANQQAGPNPVQSQIGGQSSHQGHCTCSLHRPFRFGHICMSVLSLSQELPLPARTIVESIMSANVPQAVPAGIAVAASTCRVSTGTYYRLEAHEVFLKNCLTQDHLSAGVAYTFRPPFRNDKRGFVMIVGSSTDAIEPKPFSPQGHTTMPEEMKKDILEESGVLYLPFLSVEIRRPGDEPTWGRPWIAECETAVAAIESISLNRHLNYWLQRFQTTTFDSRADVHFGVQMTQDEAKLFASAPTSPSTVSVKHMRTWCLANDIDFVDFRRTMRTILDWGAERTAYIQRCLIRMGELWLADNREHNQRFVAHIQESNMPQQSDASHTNPPLPSGGVQGSQPQAPQTRGQRTQGQRTRLPDSRPSVFNNRQ